jgi:hypothetical protein
MHSNNTLFGYGSIGSHSAEINRAGTVHPSSAVVH